MADTFVVERAQRMNASPEEVFAKISDLREWENWSPWAAMDPNMITEYSGEPGTVGSGYHWVGNRKVGEGRMTTTAVDAPNKMVIDLEFMKPFKSQNVTELQVSSAGDGSQVTWRMEGSNTLMTKIMGIFKSMDKMVGPDFEKGLVSLKHLVEE